MTFIKHTPSSSMPNSRFAMYLYVNSKKKTKTKYVRGMFLFFQRR